MVPMVPSARALRGVQGDAMTPTRTGWKVDFSRVLSADDASLFIGPKPRIHAEIRMPAEVVLFKPDERVTFKHARIYATGFYAVDADFDDVRIYQVWRQTRPRFALSDGI